ncbi:MAG: HlyD family efflux transporter periplasmic adaptor subunit [Sulfitobacter sp.]|nr:HlyD family efflux transporter periplasmic adaptor subunit [Sulfitobacter sp.]
MVVSARTFTLLAFGLALLAGLAFVSFRADPVPVDLAEVTRGPLEITVNADGRTQIRDLYEVAAPIAGMALRSPVEVGDQVVANETVVAVVRPASSGLLDARTRRQAEAALQEALAAHHVAEADLLQANERLLFARSQFDRTQALVARGVASVTRLEDDTQRLSVAQAAAEAAQARIDMAKGTIERARASLLEPGTPEETPDSCCIELKSPADGLILEVAAMSERPVAIGTPLVSVGDPHNIELVADILSTDAVRLSSGALAHVERWGGLETLEARLDRIDPKARTKVSALGIEEQRVDAYFTLVNPLEERPTLGDGFAVFLRIVEWRGEDVLQVPLSALFRSDGGWAVFVARDGVAELRPVTPGRRNGQMSAIKEGLTEGERVIMHPSDEIGPGVGLVERSLL